MKEYSQHTPKELLKLFATRGVTFDFDIENPNFVKDNELLQKSLVTVSTLGYYQLKDYAYPYFKVDIGQYERLPFRELVARYYRDKRLRNAMLHAIEDIETTLNTRIAMLLGERYGTFGYLNFQNWCQRTGRNPYLNGQKMDKYRIETEQNKFLQLIINKTRRSASKDVKEFDRTTNNVYMPIWLLMNELTLGNSIHLFKLMSKQNRKRISDQFNCNVDELVSWLECINLVRNICCHNGNLIDIKLATKPKVPLGYEMILYQRKDSYTDRIAIIICIIVKLMMSINPKYQFGNLKNALQHLVNEIVTPQSLGFKQQNSIDQLFGFNRTNFTTTPKS